MAEIGIAGSIVGIVAAGVKLTSSLYTFYGTVSEADETIRSIAADVSITTSVLQELSRNLEQDAQGRISSANAVLTAKRAIEECDHVFKRIHHILQKALNSTAPNDRSVPREEIVVHVKARLKWAFLQPTMNMLRGNLDRLKASLTLMLQVLLYAQKLSAECDSHLDGLLGAAADGASRRRGPAVEDFERVQIEAKHRETQAATSNYEELMKRISLGGSSTDDPPATGTSDDKEPGGSADALYAGPSTETVNLSTLASSHPSGTTLAGAVASAATSTVENDLQNGVSKIRELLECILTVQKGLGEAQATSDPRQRRAIGTAAGLVIQNPGFADQTFMLHDHHGGMEWHHANGRPWNQSDMMQFQSFWRRLDQHCMSKISVCEFTTTINGFTREQSALSASQPPPFEPRYARVAGMDHDGIQDSTPVSNDQSERKAFDTSRPNRKAPPRKTPSGLSLHSPAQAGLYSRHGEAFPDDVPSAGKEVKGNVQRPRDSDPLDEEIVRLLARKYRLHPAPTRTPSPPLDRTRLARRFVSPAALEEAGERFLERPGYTIVFRLFTREEIQALQTRTAEIREARSSDKVLQSWSADELDPPEGVATVSYNRKSALDSTTKMMLPSEVGRDTLSNTTAAPARLSSGEVSSNLTVIQRRERQRRISQNAFSMPGEKARMTGEKKTTLVKRVNSWFSKGNSNKTQNPDPNFSHGPKPKEQIGELVHDVDYFAAPTELELEAGEELLKETPEEVPIRGRPVTLGHEMPAELKRGRHAKSTVDGSEMPPVGSVRRIRSARKVPTGCLTCRRMGRRCDLTRPSCLRCQSFNLSCEGFGEGITVESSPKVAGGTPRATVASAFEAVAPARVASDVQILYRRSIASRFPSDSRSDGTEESDDESDYPEITPGYSAMREARRRSNLEMVNPVLAGTETKVVLEEASSTERERLPQIVINNHLAHGTTSKGARLTERGDRTKAEQEVEARAVEELAAGLAFYETQADKQGQAEATSRAESEARMMAKNQGKSVLFRRRRSMATEKTGKRERAQTSAETTMTMAAAASEWEARIVGEDQEGRDRAKEMPVASEKSFKARATALEELEARKQVIAREARLPSGVAPRPPTRLCLPVAVSPHRTRRPPRASSAQPGPDRPSMDGHERESVSAAASFKRAKVEREPGEGDVAASRSDDHLLFPMDDDEAIESSGARSSGASTPRFRPAAGPFVRERPPTRRVSSSQTSTPTTSSPDGSVRRGRRGRRRDRREPSASRERSSREDGDLIDLALIEYGSAPLMGSAPDFHRGSFTRVDNGFASGHFNEAEWEWKPPVEALEKEQQQQQQQQQQQNGPSVVEQLLADWTILSF